MNIAIFASAFYPHVGGVEELCRQLAHAYIARGHGCIVLTNRWPRDLPKREAYEGIEVLRLPFRIPEGSLKARLSYALTHGRIVAELLGILRGRVDVMHVQCVSSNGYYSLLAKRRLGLPLMVTAQGELTMDAGRLYQTSAFANRVLLELLAEADWITGCSGKTLQDVERHVGKSYPNKSSVIFNGANLADFAQAGSFAHARPYVLGIGRLVPQKGFDVLIDSFARAGLPSHDLLIAGEGPEHAPLAERAARLGLDGRVRLVGRADRQTAAALFAGCDFVALPSRSDEGLPLVSVEAMAAGKAIVACRVGGVPESVVDGRTGLLVAPQDVGALAGAMRRLAGDAELRGRLAAAGRERARGFDWNAIAAQYLDLYRRLSP